MNKKGFTLIELLAVIVILAIIALIATPIVLNIINDTKSDAELRSAGFYLDAVEMAVAQATLDEKSINAGTYDIMPDGNICLATLTDGKCIGKDNRENHEEDILIVEVKGEKPKSGTITIAQGQVENVAIKLSDKVIEKMIKEH